MSYYIGKTPDDILGGNPRYFYGFRRTDEGKLFFARVDQLSGTDGTININTPGNPDDNYEDFEVGIDFFEGRDVYHNMVFENLNYEQYKWDDRSVFYYINDDGELIVRINAGYTYPSGL